MRVPKVFLAIILILATLGCGAAQAQAQPREKGKGKPEVLATLQKMLRGELGAVSQYMLHAEMCENWGYNKLAEHTEKRAITEMKHAEKLMARMLYLDGGPEMLDLPALTIGPNVKAQLTNDLALELAAVLDYNEAIAVCRKAGDNGSAELLESILKDEESHVDFLEAQLGVIKDVGLENYLSQQI